MTKILSIEEEIELIRKEERLEGKAEGIELGREIGLELGRAKGIKVMIAGGMPIEEIAKGMDMSVDEVEALSRK